MFKLKTTLFALALAGLASYMKDFLFLPEQTRSPVSVLSGGERARLLLALALALPSNLLVLDEPTNDLDLETLDLLQELLSDYEGTVLLVSHDPDFLDRVVTSTIASEGDGRWLEYAGGYSDMLAQRRGRPEPAATREQRRDPGQPNDRLQTAAKPAEPAKRKLSFKEKHALETLPVQMEKLQAEIARLEARLTDPGYFARDPRGFDTDATALTKARQTLATAEEQWLELEMKREELEGA